MADEFSVELTGRPFLLRPDTPKEGRPKELYPGQVPGELTRSLAEIAKDAGVEMRQPDVTPYALYALQATEYAREHGSFEEFHRSAFRAYWAECRDIGSLDVVRVIAESNDLDWGELGPLLEEDRYEATVLSQMREASAMGIKSVPAFAIGKYVFSGAQPYEFFRSVAVRVLDEREDP